MQASDHYLRMMALKKSISRSKDKYRYASMIINKSGKKIPTLGKYVQFWVYNTQIRLMICFLKSEQKHLHSLQMGRYLFKWNYELNPDYSKYIT